MDLNERANGWRTRWWAGRDNAILSKTISSHENCLKTRRVPQVGCTLFWAVIVWEFHLASEVRMTIKSLRSR
jgi:hypothetical protein